MADATGEIATQVVAADGGGVAAEVVHRIHVAPRVEDAGRAEGGELVDETVNAFQGGLSIAREAEDYRPCALEENPPVPLVQARLAWCREP
jgi:hypothetical protein